MPIYDRPEWTALGHEPALDPHRRIIDAHHHLWRRPDSVYGGAELAADAAATHHVTHSVFVECNAAYDGESSDAMAPVAETRFVIEEHQHARSGGIEIAAIVGHVDLSLGDAVRPVLEAHIKAGLGRFRGVRHGTNWSQHPEVKRGHHRPTQGLMGTPEFERGVGLLGDMGLTFDAWLYFDQLHELTALARANPQTTIICDHLGGPIGIGPWAGAGRLAMLERWEIGVTELSRCPNVAMKIGGLGMEHYFGTPWAGLSKPPTSRIVAAWWSEIVERVIELFGPDRCMFESNFPVDRQTLPYSVVWNAFQRLAAPYSDDEQQEMFCATAARVYGIED